MKLYREVPVSERLPAAETSVFIGHHQDDWVSSGYHVDGIWFNDYDHECQCYPEYWLEAVELPTDEEVKRTAYEFQQKSSIMDDDAYSFRRGVKWLKERLGL